MPQYDLLGNLVTQPDAGPFAGAPANVTYGTGGPTYGSAAIKSANDAYAAAKAAASGGTGTGSDSGLIGGGGSTDDQVYYQGRYYPSSEYRVVPDPNNSQNPGTLERIEKPQISTNTSSVISGSVGGGSASGLGSASPSNILAGGVNIAPPTKINPLKLRQLLAKVERRKAIKQAMRQYDELSAITESSGLQQAQNAGTAYSNRLLQQGINPVASGVVAAQAKIPVLEELAKIGVQKAETKITATNKSDILAAQIAQAITGIKETYSKTLADFNIKQADLNLDLNKFNASQQLGYLKLGSEESTARAGQDITRTSVENQYEISQQQNAIAKLNAKIAALSAAGNRNTDPASRAALLSIGG